MNTLLLDYGTNTYKIGISKNHLDSVKLFNGFDEKDFAFDLSCKKKGNMYVIDNDNKGDRTVSDIIGIKEPLKSFLITQPMEFEKIKEKYIKNTFEHFFEHVGMEMGNILLQPIAACLAHSGDGIKDLLIVDSGESATFVIPICESFILHDSIERTPLGGETVTKELLKHLLRNQTSSCSIDYLDAQLIKEKYLKVCPNFDKYQNLILDKYNFFNTEVVLPDGSKIKLGREVYDLSEPLFSPLRFGLDGLGIAEKIHTAIKVI